MSEMFLYCSSLYSLKVPDDFGKNAKRMYNIFKNCNKLASDIKKKINPKE